MTNSATPPTDKICKVCGVSKPLDDYYRATDTRDGYRGECKACNLARRAAKYREDPGPARDRVRRWQEANPDRYAERQRAYSESGRKAIANRKSHLKRKYGLTLEQYDAMLAAQGGVCAICGQPRPEDRKLHVDHDHATGEVRGLLCFKCNNALGDFNEDAELFYVAAGYLDRDEELAEMARNRARALAL